MAAAHGRFNGIRHVAPVCTPPMLPWATRVQMPNGISISSAVFTRLTAESCNTSQRDAVSPPTYAFQWGDLDLHLLYGSLGHSSTQPKRHLDRFSRFAGLTTVTDRPTDRLTDRTTDHATRSVITGRVYVCSTAMMACDAA